MSILFAFVLICAFQVINSNESPQRLFHRVAPMDIETEI